MSSKLHSVWASSASWALLFSPLQSTLAGFLSGSSMTRMASTGRSTMGLLSWLVCLELSSDSSSWELPSPISSWCFRQRQRVRSFSKSLTANPRSTTKIATPSLRSLSLLQRLSWIMWPSLIRQDLLFQYSRTSLWPSRQGRRQPL